MSDELLSAFIVEGRELTDQAAAALQALQAAKDDWPALDQLFRAFHTLKGSAGLMGFEAMTALFHVAEDRLGEARAAGVGLDPALAQTLLAVLDQTEAWLDDAEAAERLPADADVAALMARLGIAAASVETTASGDEAPAWSASLLGDTPPDPGRYVAIRYAPAEDAYLKGEDPAAVMEGLPGLVRLQIAPRTPFSDLPAYDPFACNLVFTALSQAAETQVREALKLAAGQVEIASLTVADEARAADAGPLRTLRVESARMDELAAATDDLAVIKNRLAHLLAETGRQVEPALGRELAKAQSDLEHRVSRLHDAVSRLRTTPLAPVFRRFPRLVRETSAALGKEVALSLEGSDVELDKTLVDALFEPLLHLVRNALDHGIETSDQRRALGKPVPAKLRITAQTMGDEAVIEVADDGRGIDLARVRAAAVDRGIIAGDALTALSDEGVLDLIFAPGFSTAKVVGDLSGRGVGLDAVRTAVGALGGRVEAASEPGLGSRLTIALPLQVRMARIMMVHAGQETFGVPLEAVVETARVKAASVTPVRAGRAFVWRDRPLPLLNLATLLNLPEPAPQAETRVLIVNAGDDLAAVAVDGFGERIESPLRPMTGLLARAPGVAGTTLLGDGRVLMVLDLPELIG